MNRKQEIAEFVWKNHMPGTRTDDIIECIRLIEMWDAAHRPQPPTQEQREELAKGLWNAFLAGKSRAFLAWEKLGAVDKDDCYRQADAVISRYGPPPASEPKEKCGECEAVKVLSEVLHQVAGVLDVLDVPCTTDEGGNLGIPSRMRCLLQKIDSDREEAKDKIYELITGMMGRWCVKLTGKPLDMGDGEEEAVGRTVDNFVLAIRPDADNPQPATDVERLRKERASLVAVPFLIEDGDAHCGDTAMSPRDDIEYAPGDTYETLLAKWMNAEYNDDYLVDDENRPSLADYIENEVETVPDGFWVVKEKTIEALDDVEYAEGSDSAWYASVRAFKAAIDGLKEFEVRK